jgi:hypothetical protein
MLDAGCWIGGGVKAAGSTGSRQVSIRENPSCFLELAKFLSNSPGFLRGCFFKLAAGCLVDDDAFDGRAYCERRRQAWSAAAVAL